MVQFSQGLPFEYRHLPAGVFEVLQENAEMALPIVCPRRISGLPFYGTEGAL